MDIHLNWVGPMSLEAAHELLNQDDVGLYQWYGDHPVYGAETLLYIGMAFDQRLGERLEQENWGEWIPSTPSLYVGRVCTENGSAPNNGRTIVMTAEKVLLFSHSPAFNSSNLNNIDGVAQDVRVLNWGMRKSLLPEVSVYRWVAGGQHGHRLPNGLSPVQWSN
ncbi:MAG: hypothetical protein HYZ17_03045 [Betaproteobacteria bacterium]|nr:hypothetical protein [Betaproteobacteria bacterium]